MNEDNNSPRIAAKFVNFLKKHITVLITVVLTAWYVSYFFNPEGSSRFAFVLTGLFVPFGPFTLLYSMPFFYIPPVVFVAMVVLLDIKMHRLDLKLITRILIVFGFLFLCTTAVDLLEFQHFDSLALFLKYFGIYIPQTNCC